MNPSEKPSFSNHEFEAPLFSIGVTTYNRPKLLKETLISILTQTQSDFEVIIGNDFVEQPISKETLGMHDPRLRIINYPQNLGEFENMNTLLAKSKGRYFTWLGDDDMYLPTFLENIHQALTKFDFPSCVFTTFISGATPPDNMCDFHTAQPEGELISGRQFLQRYLNRSIQVQGLWGVFDREYITRLGGIKLLCNEFHHPLYGDNLLAIQCGLLEKLVYIDAPLVFFRTHEKSVSWTTSDLGAYITAQENLWQESMTIFRHESLADDFESNLSLLFKWSIRDILAVVRRSQKVNIPQIKMYLSLLRKYMKFLKSPRFYWQTRMYEVRITLRLILSIMKKNYYL
ncbi:MAG: hypothetical protein B6242_00825 [Anaerolineaceae bacterium 4572_78]|nr:MAG: hypothetical protein B6242_00825 [Anaerolineaceae bacterium 4572_78]